MSQAQDILDYLWTGNTLTPLEALDKFKCFRLASRIHELRKAGYAIETIPPTDSGKDFAVYYLIGYMGEKSVNDPKGVSSFANRERRAVGKYGGIAQSASPQQADFLTNSILNDKAS